MTIYATPFDPDTRKPTGHSTDSGFESLEQARAVMGEPLKQTEALLVYPGGMLFSRTAFWKGELNVCN